MWREDGVGVWILGARRTQRRRTQRRARRADRSKSARASLLGGLQHEAGGFVARLQAQRTVVLQAHARLDCGQSFELPCTGRRFGENLAHGGGETVGRAVLLDQLGERVLAQHQVGSTIEAP